MRTLLQYLILGLSLLFIVSTPYAEIVNLNKADADTLQRQSQGKGIQQLMLNQNRPESVMIATTVKSHQWPKRQKTKIEHQ